MLTSRTLKTGLRIVARQTRFGSGRAIAVPVRSNTSFSDASVAKRWYAVKPAQAKRAEEAEVEAAVDAVKEAEAVAEVEAVVNAAATEAAAEQGEPQTLQEAEAALEAKEDLEVNAEVNNLAEAAASKAAEAAAANTGGQAAAEPTSAGTVAVDAPSSAAAEFENEEAEYRANSICIKNIPWAATEESLRAVLEQAAPVERLSLIRRRDDNRLNGLGFVNFFDPSKNSEYIARLDGIEFLGRNLYLSPSLPRATRPQGTELGNKIYVRDLPVQEGQTFNTAALQDAVEAAYGLRPTYIAMHRDRVTSQLTGTAHFNFAGETDGLTILAAVRDGNAFSYLGQAVQFRRAKPRTTDAAGQRAPRRRNYDTGYSAGIPAGEDTQDQSYQRNNFGSGYGESYGAEGYGGRGGRGQQRGGFRGRQRQQTGYDDI